MSSLVAGLLNQTIDTIYSTSSSGYGDKTETILYTNIPCRWQEISVLNVDAAGEKIDYEVKNMVCFQI